MVFIGRLKQQSAIWKRWHGEARTGGVLHGVHFAWEPGNIYRTLPLAPDQIERLRTHDNIFLEAISIDTTPPAVAAAAKPVVNPGMPARVNNTPPRRA